MIPALALLILGYDVGYYALNVLIWAHVRTDGADPVPFRYCIGIPMGKGGATKFKAPIRLGASYAKIKAALPREFFGEGNYQSTESTIGTAISDFFTKPGSEVYGTGPNSTNPFLPQNQPPGSITGTVGRVAPGNYTSQNRPPSGAVPPIQGPF